MAAHVESVKSSGIEQVTKAEFYQALRGGDLVFCSGNYAISRGIEAVTGSPFSHVLMAWLPYRAQEWLTLESTAKRGVHVGRLSDYVDRYQGDLVITRRFRLTSDEIYASLNAGFALLEDAYDVEQEISIVAHKLCAALPIVQPRAEYYCSGLQYAMSLATSKPLQRRGEAMPTPEDNWTDPSVQPICALVRAA